MDQVTQWVHATSEENLALIRDDGFLKPNSCTSVFFDEALTQPDAPTGTWFNANNYRGGPITMTIYPERIPSDVPTVPGLKASVQDLLRNAVPEGSAWQLFRLPVRKVGYTQVKYVIALETDPKYHWLTQNVPQVTGNKDEYVELTHDDDGTVWRARDAQERILISVFYVTPMLDGQEDEERGIPFELFRSYRLSKRPSPQAEHLRSQGRLMRA
mmetsp:Transcript_56659/g.121994  ORF Transcript_56659/g.121994 Transcript_56659/m.121994 type:complete len:214 (-) Transcript_56659:169-810(-)